jgi:hypothetical protein
MPTDREVPLFVSNHFGAFYRDVFNKTWKQEGRNAVFLEYAWDATPNYGVKCDPCVGNPPMLDQLVRAGASWLQPVNPNQTWNGGAPVFFTRLHVRYSNALFPQDLMFMETPNRENFQCRYVIHYPASGDLSCTEGQQYLQELNMRKRRELQELNALTSWNEPGMQKYLNDSYFVPEKPDRKGESGALPGIEEKEPPHFPGLMEIINLVLLLGISILLIARSSQKIKP